MNLLARLFRRSASLPAPDTNARWARAIGAGFRALGTSITEATGRLWQTIIGGGGDRRFLSLFTGWVFACITCRAEALAELTWNIYVRDAKADDGRSVAPDSHWLVRLKENPNPLPWVTWDTLIEGIEKWQSIAGEAYLWTPRNGGKVPAQLWLVPATLCAPVSSETDLLSHFTLRTPRGIVRIPREEMCYIPLTQLSDNLADSLLRGRGRIEMAIDAIESSVYRQRYLKNYFLKGAMPEWVIESEGAGGEFYSKDWEAFLARWLEQHQGPEANVPLGYLPSGWKLREVNTTANKAALAEMDARDIEAICSVFRTPKGYVTGQFDAAAPASSYKAQKYTFLDGTIAPSAKRIGGILTRWAQQYDPSVVIATEPVKWSDPVEVRADERHRLSTMRATPNDIRRENGEEPISEDWADAYLIDPSLGVRADEYLKPPKEEDPPPPPMLPAPPPDAPPDTPADTPDAPSDATTDTTPAAPAPDTTEG